jgi:hypothetical protein
MAVTGLTATAFQNNAVALAFTVADVDLTGRVVRFAMSLIDPRTGLFDPTEPALTKDSEEAGHMTLVDGPNGEIDVNIEDVDTAQGSAVGAGDYQFQLEVFDANGANGVVVSEGVLTMRANIGEPV